MFKQIFKHSEEVTVVNYFEQYSINLFTIDLLISCVSIAIGILLLFSFNYQINVHIVTLCVFPIIYLLSYNYNIQRQFEISYILYHICSYFLIVYLIILYGKSANFHLYFFSIGFSIYLYATEKKSYHEYILFLYVFTFVVVNLYNYEAIFRKEVDLTTFLSSANLILSSTVITLKAVKYVDLKERAVEEYKKSQLKALKTERQLKDKQAIFDFLFNSSLNGAEFSIESAINKQEITYDVNNSLMELLKMDKETIKDADRISISPEFQSNGKKSSEYDKEIKELISKNNQYRYEWDYINGNGEIVNTEITQIRLNESDKIINLGFIKDITLKKQTEKELLESELMYRTIFENVYDGIKIDVYDIKNNKPINQFVNQKMLDLFKINEYNFEEDDYLKFVPERQLDNKNSLQFIAELREEFEQKFEISFRMNLINANKEYFTADFTAIQIETEATRKVVLISKDVTEIVRKEQIIKNQILVLEKKKEQLLKYIESNKQLELFAFRASHDLKGPITTVTKFINILKTRNMDKFDEESLSYFKYIETSITHLKVFIDDCLNHSRITSKKINIQNINPAQTIQVVLNILKSSIEDSNAKVNLGAMPDWINADEIKLITLLQNLISNALKYRKKNLEPIITINCIEQESYYKFSISDNGIGIKVEHQSKIFDLYESFHESDQQFCNIKQKGTGIGLSTCLKLVELHKGKIWVNSIYGEGSTFHFVISKNLNQVINN